MWYRMYYMQQAAALHTLEGTLLSLLFAKFTLLKFHHLGVMKHFDFAIHT